MRWSGAAEVVGHPQDIVLGGATSQSGLLQGRSRVPTLQKAVLLERGGWSLRPDSAEDSARQAASFAFGRIAIGELAVYHAVAEERKVGGSRKAPSVSARGLRMGLAAREGARTPEVTRGPPTA